MNIVSISQKTVKAVKNEIIELLKAVRNTNNYIIIRISGGSTFLTNFSNDEIVLTGGSAAFVYISCFDNAGYANFEIKTYASTTMVKGLIKNWEFNL